MARAACIVDGCASAPSRGRMCNTHYLRVRRHGDPHHRQRAANGELHAWLVERVDWSGDECLTWPFAKGRDGRGRLTGSVSPQAHRAMCILAHGEPPTRRHEAAHSCGKGHEACVNPRHLRWATPVENAADRVIHGTEVRGSAKPGAKLTESDVLAIRALKGSATQREIGDRFGVDGETVGNIHRGETWAWLASPA